MFADENVSKQITMKGFYVPAALSLMLLSLPIAAQSVATDTILLATFNDSISLDEVVIKAHKTPRANSRWSDLQPVDLVTVGGSNGDLYRALQTLPGVQLQGESGRLLVRGGNSNETQTYIDGMHVLNPYTTTGVIYLVLQLRLLLRWLLPFRLYASGQMYYQSLLQNRRFHDVPR